MATETIELLNIEVKTAIITIEGTTDLVLNKMNDINSRQLIEARKNKAKKTETPNLWEEIITAIHWRDGKPTEFSEESLIDALKNNAPCVSAFGLKKSLGNAIVRSGAEKYATRLDANLNINSRGGLIPITFTEHYIDEKLMSPKKGSPVLVHLNRFTGWRADFEIAYVDGIYSLEQLVNIINIAGFGIGIGSGRTSGYGRYKVVNVR